MAHLRPKYVFFDFDGTLADTEGPEGRRLSRLLAEIGVQADPDELARRYMGLPRAGILPKLEAAYGVELSEAWRARYDQSRRVGREPTWKSLLASSGCSKPVQPPG